MCKPGENLPLPIIFKAAFGGGGRGMRVLVMEVVSFATSKWFEFQCRARGKIPDFFCFFVFFRYQGYLRVHDQIFAGKNTKNHTWCIPCDGSPSFLSLCCWSSFSFRTCARRWWAQWSLWVWSWSVEFERSEVHIPSAANDVHLSSIYHLVCNIIVWWISGIEILIPKINDTFQVQEKVLHHHRLRDSKRNLRCLAVVHTIFGIKHSSQKSVVHMHYVYCTSIMLSYDVSMSTYYIE